MNTIDQLMRAGDDLMTRIIIPGETNWQAEAANIPDDAYPEEGGVIERDDDDDDTDLDTAANAAKDSYYDPEQEKPDILMQELRKALAADLQPLGEALAGALQAGDGAAFQAAIKKISGQMPEFMNSPALEALLQTEFVQSLTETTDDES